MEILGTVLVGLVILIGLGGALTQIYPGPLLVLGAVAVWAVAEGSTTAWVALAVSTVAVVGTGVGKYALVGRLLTVAGVPSRSLLVGGLLGIIGFFVIPVVGLPLGFTLGVYLWELARLRDEPAARAAVWIALKAQGMAILLELGGSLVAALAWLLALILG